MHVVIVERRAERAFPTSGRWRPPDTRAAGGQNRGMKPRALARWVTRSVPGVYGAARDAGLGRRDAVRVVEASA